MPGVYLATEDGSPIKDSNGLPVKLVDANGDALLVNADGSINTVLTGSTQADGAGSFIPSLGYNGVTYDRQRNNNSGILLASGERSVNTSSANIVNYNAKGIIVFLNTTIASGTGGIKVLILGIDPITGKTIQLNADPTALVGVGVYGYILYPGSSITTGAGQYFVVQNTLSVLPRTFKINVSHGDATNYTYSVGYSLIL